MPSKLTLVKQVALPSQSAVVSAFKSVNLADAFSIQLPSGASKDPDVLARFIFSVQPSWIGALTNVRDAIVAAFGLKTAKHLATLSSDPAAKRISIFRVFSISETEVVLGENDNHLVFRVFEPAQRLLILLAAVSAFGVWLLPFAAHSSPAISGGCH